MSEKKTPPSPHCHPESLDTGSTPAAFVARELELGTGTVTATDHGTMQAVRTVYDLAKKNNLTPILGLEGYHRDDNCSILAAAGLPKDEEGTYKEVYKYGHFCVHFEDQKAYEKGSVILSRADARAEQHGGERKPLFDWSDMEELGAENVTMTSGCLIGVTVRHMLARGDAKTAVKYYQKMRSLVKPGSFYVEIFPHDCSRDYVNAIFVDLEGGERVRFRAKGQSYKGKTIRVSGETIKADQLLNRKEYGVLESVKDYFTWNDREPKQILRVENVEGFIENECKPWQHGNPDVQVAANKFMLALANHYGDPILISDDSHYARAEDKVVQDTRLAQSGNWRFWGSFHRYSGQECFEHFQRTMGISEKEFDSWVDNNYAWASRFKNFKFVTPVSLPTKFYPSDTLPELMRLIKAGGRMRWNDRRYTERLVTEVNLLHRNGTTDLLPYFFLAEEAIGEYRRKGIVTGPGRGSAAGLLIAYLLHITHIDPLRPDFNLSLERFMTLDRVQAGAYPDIDNDFPSRETLEGTDEHPEDGWLHKRFGDHYAQISTNMTLRVRAAAKDVARLIHKFVPPEVEELTKQFTIPAQGVTDHNHVFGYTSEDGKEVPGAITYDVALQTYISKFPQEWVYVQKCLSLTRGKSRHASAFCVMNRPIQELMPTMSVGGVRTTQFTADSVEKMGGIKMDFLVVRALLAIGDVVKLVQERSGLTIPPGGSVLPNRGLVPFHHLVPHAGSFFDIWDLPEEDAVFQEIAAGKTETVFQFSTEAAIGWLKFFDGNRPDGRPAITSVYDLAVFTSLDRPGPLNAFVPDPQMPGQTHNMLVEYAHRARGLPPSPGILPVMDQLLPKTHGIMVFQEQLQYMYQELTQCTLTEAEQFRRDVAKKKMEKVEKAFGFFFPRAAERLGSEQAARQAWETFLTFGEYGFNMSHAVCYAMIGYVCAWMKHHYTLEWWCAIMRNAKKDDVAKKHWSHAGHLIDLPDISRVAPNFEIVDQRIVAPVSLLQGVGEIAHAQLMQYAPYANLGDLVAKIEAHKDAGAKLVRKMKKNKKTKIEEEVEVLQRGKCAINRGTIYRLIIVGAMNHLFPPEVREQGVLEQLAYYEKVFAEGTGAKRPAPVPEWYGRVGALARYALRKKILPVYNEDVRSIVYELKRPDITKINDPNLKHEGYHWKGHPLLLGRDVRRLDTYRPLPAKGITVAAVAYVVDTRQFTYQDTKQACEMFLDIDSESFKVVAWPKRGRSTKFNELKGHIVLVELNRWQDHRGFSIETMESIQAPVKDEDKEKEKEGDG